MGELGWDINRRLCFVIAHKYFKGYESCIKQYVETIVDSYPDARVLIVDNNSGYLNEVFQDIDWCDGVTWIDNKKPGKFEIGAYYAAMCHEDLSQYGYVVFSQDNFILKKRYDFEHLLENKIKAASLVSWTNDWAKMDICSPILDMLQLSADPSARLCWCHSFIVSGDMIPRLQEIFSKIDITTRHQSEASERYLGQILFDMNEGVNHDIDGDIDQLSYQCMHVTSNTDVREYFCKMCQQKNENTRDIV
jgi:hypothetical protein